MNSRKTFSQNARHADPLFRPSTLQYTVVFFFFPFSPPFLLTQHDHLPTLLPLYFTHAFSPFCCSPLLGICSGVEHKGVLFLPQPHPPPSSSVLKTVTHMACFDDHSHHSQKVSTCLTLSSLNYITLIDTLSLLPFSLMSPQVTLDMM